MVVYLKESKLEEFLARKNITQTDFAKKIGISRTYLSMLKDPEKYKFSPSPEVRQKIQDFLGVDFDEIFLLKNARFDEQKGEDGIDALSGQIDAIADEFAG